MKSSGRNISFLVTKRELKLLEEACLYGGDADRNLEAAVLEKDQYRLSFSYEELDDLAGFVAASANHEKSRRKRDKCDELFVDIGEEPSSAVTKGVKNTKIAQAFKSPGDRMLFLFDYGDSWRFAVELKEIRQAETRINTFMKSSCMAQSTQTATHDERGSSTFLRPGRTAGEIPEGSGHDN